MPGVYLEYIKAGKFVVPVELTFQTETIKAPGDIRGLVNTSKWIERHNWKEIKAMLKPAVEACLKYNETPLENIPKSHHISYGREVSLGYLIVPNKISTPFLSVLDTKKNCWTDDEDDEDELLGITDSVQMEDHGQFRFRSGAFTEFIPTKTAIRVCVVKKSVVSIDDARRIRKELGVRSDDVRHYFSSQTHMPNEPGPSSKAHENEQLEGTESEPVNKEVPVENEPSSDSEVENIPRTFGDPDEIRDAARIYPHVLNRDVDSGNDPDDDIMSLPDIEPHPPKKKKGSRLRKKSSSMSPSKSKRLTHNNILAIAQEGKANFSEEDSSFSKRKKSKRKRTVAVVEPMRTLPNGQMSFEHAIGALSSEKRRKSRPGSSHGGDKTHSGSGRSKQPPAIDIIAPDDDRLTITNPPLPIHSMTPSTSTSTPTKETEEMELELERKKVKSRRKRRRKNFDDDDPHKWERLTPSPLFDNSSEDPDPTDTDTEPEMPVLMKMVDSDEERKAREEQELEQMQLELEYIPGIPEEAPVETLAPPDTPSKSPKSEVNEENRTPTPAPLPPPSPSPPIQGQSSDQVSPDITQTKVANANVRKKREQRRTYKRRLKLSNDEEEIKTSDTESIKSNRSTSSKLSNVQTGKFVEQCHSPGPSNSRESSRERSRVTLRSESKLSDRILSTEENSNLSNNSEGTDNHISPAAAGTPPLEEPKESRSNSPLVTVTAEQVKREGAFKSSKPSIETPKKPPATRSRKVRQTTTKKVASHQQDMKPMMVDAQTETDDLHIIEVKKLLSPNIMVDNSIVKVSRSCEASSEEDFDMGSQRSQTPSKILDSQLLMHRPAHNLISQTQSQNFVGSHTPNRDDDDGLFSFDSPTLPLLSVSQNILVNYEDSDEKSLSPASESASPENTLNLSGNDIDTEMESPVVVDHDSESESPASPQPGCSHWVTPFASPFPMPAPRSPSPPLLSSILMPPPTSRPPRTPRKGLNSERDDEPPKLSVCGENDDDMLDLTAIEEDDSMPIGADATFVSDDMGRTYNTLNQHDVFKSGLRLIQKVASKQLTPQEVERKLKFGDGEQEEISSKAIVPYSGSPQRKRALSPDICELVPDKKLSLVVAARRSRRESFEESRRERRRSVDGEESRSGPIVLRRSISDDEASDIESSNNFAMMGYLSRQVTPQAAYEPQGDEFDLSQRSHCMLNVIPEYEKKSRTYKIHSKAVREATLRQLIEHFNFIKSDLCKIFQGKIPSERHKIFVSTHDAKKHLRNLSVTVPFNSEQCQVVVNLLYDHMVPDKRMRCEYMDYINFVLVPEALIRIFCRINNIAYHMAETEMRFGACYEGPVPDGYFNHSVLD